MMSDLLTQQEIDALLTVSDDFDFDDSLGRETTVAEIQTDRRIRKYDFASREKVIHGDWPILDHINDRFSGYLRKSLSVFLGASVEVDRSAIQVQQLSEYGVGLPLQSHLSIIKCSPLRGRAVIAMEPRLVFTVIDHYFGGGGQSKSPGDKKELTPVMNRVIQRVLALILKDLKEAWRPVMALDFDCCAPESNPIFANIAGPDGIVVISTIHLQLRGGNGDFNIAMPYSMIEPVKALSDNPGSVNSEDDPLWQTTFRKHILQAEVSVASRLTEKIMSIGDVMQLKTGDVIPIDKPEKAVLCVEDMPVYEGMAEVSGGRNALKIIGRIGS